VRQSHLIIEASRSHSGTPHSVGLLWTSDRSDAETTWQHTTLSRDRHSYIGGIRTHKPSGRRPTACRLDASLPEDRSTAGFRNVLFLILGDGPTKSKRGDCVSELYTIVHVHRYGSHFQNKQVTMNLISNQQISLDYVSLRTKLSFDL